MAIALPPIDTSVTVPESVRKAAAAANAMHKAAYPDGAPLVPDVAPAANLPLAPPDTAEPRDQPIQIVPVSDPPAPPAAAVQPDLTPPAPPAQPDNWEHRYLSMKGRYDQSIATMGGMQDQMQQMGSELQRMTAMLEQRARQEQPRAPAKKLITADDEKTYGTEIIDLAKRAAMETIGPELAQVRAENQQLRQRVGTQAAAGVWSELTQAVPNWKEINTSPRFLAWLRSPDLYSGVVRGGLLKQAFAAADAPRVTSFFKGFLAEEELTGQLPSTTALPAAPAPRIAAVDLATLAAPGVRPAADLQQSVDKPIFTHKQISEFYSHQGRLRYVGRDEDRKNDEREIFAAQREGRIR